MIIFAIFFIILFVFCICLLCIRALKELTSFRHTKIIGCLAGTSLIAFALLARSTILLLALLHIWLIELLCQFLFLIINRFRQLPTKLTKTGTVPVLITIVILTMGYFNIADVRRVEYNIDSDKVTSPIRIAMISDVHLGNAMNAEDLREFAEKINAEQPDVLVLVGDIFDDNTKRRQMEKSAEILSTVETKYGIYFVFGNHDADFYGVGMNFSMEDVENAFSENGITVLKDEAAVFGDINILGRIDFAAKDRADVKTLTKSIDKSKFTLVLDHQPKELKKLKKAGVDLLLSGHTHGGQIFPTRQLCELFDINELNYGPRTDGSFTAITSSGLSGWGFPVRTQGHSEYLIVNIE